MKTKLVSLFLVLLFAVSCKDDVPPMLALHTPQQEGNSIVLNWEQPGISGFQYYAVMRAIDGQNYQIINDITNPASEAFRKEITTFADNSYPLEADTLYYKIMAVGDETAVSENVLFRNKNKVKFITGNIQDMYFIEETNQISVVDYASDDYNYGHRLRVFDLQTGTFLPNTMATLNLSYSTSWCFGGKYNGKTELYNYNGENTMYVYDTATARQVAQIQMPSCWNASYATNNQGMIYIFSYYLYLINRATGNYTQYQPSNQMYHAGYLHYNSKDNKLYAIDRYNYNQMIIFHLNEDGSVASDELFTINDNNDVPVFIENSSLFIVNVNGQVKILDMNDKTYHSTSLINPNLYDTKAILANNNIYIYLASYLHAIGHSTEQITKMSCTDYSVVQTLNTRATPRKMFVTNGYLYYFGQYQYNTYILDKIKL